MSGSTYAIVTDITPNFGDVAWLGTDRDELFGALEGYGDEAEVYVVRPMAEHFGVKVGDRVRLEMLGERVSWANL